jgi:[ribosomal protein S5]-alanine N-acetyltransferase
VLLRSPPAECRRCANADAGASAVVTETPPVPRVLRAARIELRPYVPADFAAIHAYACDPEVTRYSAWGPNDEAASHTFLDAAIAAQVDPGIVYRYAIELRESGVLIGGCNVEIESVPHRRAEFGYVLARPWWGKGLATEAAGLLRSLAFDVLGIHRLQATCHPDNIRSRRVLEKTGLTYEGRLRGHQLMRGEWRDSLLYAEVNRAS